MTKKKMTAEELKKQLTSDGNYQQMMKAKEIERQKLDDLLSKDEQPLIEDLRSLSLNIDSVWDLVNTSSHTFLENKFTGDYSVAYETLVRHLDYDYHPKTIEGIIRALTEKQAKNIATEKILELFYKEKDKDLKWVMANALSTLMTWNKRQKHPEIGKVLKGK